ncbi:MAG: hypothetical protein GX759_04930 [Thermoanaerobacterales bacterium]|nr:hypothetical protein [Thermoanaerobacterales bacterium]
MLTKGQKKGVIFGIIWGFFSWVPYYTEYLGNIRNLIGIPATLGLNLELVLNKGNAFVFSIIMGAGICFFIVSLFEFLRTGVKVIGLFPYKKRRMLKRGL